MPTLQIIVASTRPGRVGLPVAKWFQQRAEAYGAFDVEMLDLAEWNLPFLDEPAHPRLHQYTKEHTKRWSAAVERGDAYVLVTAEYNYGYPAPLKNALDFLSQEWQYKPVGFVSYGGVAAGTRAVQALKPVLLALRMLVANDAVYIPMVGQHVKDGVFEANEALDRAAHALLDEVKKLEAASRVLRSKNPS